MNHVFIIGSKGIPANYGGFETFVHKLTQYRKDKDIKYHVACLSEDDNEFEFNNARCFNVKVKKIGPARAVLYDLLALNKVMEYVKLNEIKNSTLYILACRIGPFLNFYKNKLTKLGIKVIVNPDGHEWKRSKWNTAIKLYWRYSEKLMVKNSDFLVCDSVGIENYIKFEYKGYKPNTTFIAYGADINNEPIKCNEQIKEWFNKFNVRENEYYLIVGRFVPENNYETMIKEFMKSNTNKDLVIITNVEQNKFFENIKKCGFENDKRVKFVGTVYDEQMLKYIRQEAFAYIHGHEVGGTNPSLLEALATTRLNILLDVVFNKEVAENSALYFDKSDGMLKSIIDEVEKYNEEKIQEFSLLSKQRIISKYSWEYIIDCYENFFSKMS